MLSLGIRGV